MDVGGSEYKKLKEELDRLSRVVYDTERLLTRNKTTIGSSESNLRKVDQEIERSKNEIDKLHKAKSKLQEELEKNDMAGQKLL